MFLAHLVLGIRVKFTDHTLPKHGEISSSASVCFSYDQPYPLVGCHLSLFDIVIMAYYCGCPSFATKVYTLYSINIFSI
jgi:hypothetical protein